MAKHTATPWFVRGGADPDIYSEDGTWIVNQVCSGAGDEDDDGRANAQFIVTACNAHDALLAVAKELVSVKRAGVGKDLVQAANAAIALAESEAAK